MGLDPDSGEVEVMEDLAVAAFACPAHTVTGIAAYSQDPDAPRLPLLSYAAIGYAEGRFWVCAKKVDEDRRQVFEGIPEDRIRNGAMALMRKYPDNRLMRHLTNCALNYGCPAAKNLSLGRFEAPLPTSQACNARCVGCISLQPEDSGFPAPQNRIGFTPTCQEIVEVMRQHGSQERKPVFSFGQGCEGEPLTEAKLLAESTRLFRSQDGKGTVNVNTNASLPDTIPLLAEAGVSSIRVSLNSVRKAPYEAYYRPHGYVFEDVVESIRQAKKHGLFVSLNYLYFPGLNDTEEELDALNNLLQDTHLDFMQLRNLNLDPQLALDLLGPHSPGPAMGLNNFRKRLRKTNEWLGFGYFNPYLEGQ